MMSGNVVFFIFAMTIKVCSASKSDKDRTDACIKYQIALKHFVALI